MQTSLRRLGAGLTSVLLASATVVVPLAGDVGPVDAAAGAGFTLNLADMRFILKQIQIAEAHASTESLDSTGTPVLGAVNPATSVLGPGVNDVPDPLLPWGLRQVDGRNNNLLAGRSEWGAADTPFLRSAPPTWRSTPAAPSFGISAGNYGTRTGNLADVSPRTISNLIADQSSANPAASAAGSKIDADGSIVVPNVAPNAGVGAPYNGMFALFGQFFDHGLDLVPKSSTESVVVPLRAGDPLYDPSSPTNFMVASRTILDQNGDGTNITTPWIDQNQTYTSHPSHQVFLREYASAAGRPVATGKFLDGGNCATGDLAHVCNLANWAEIKAQAATQLGILLVDKDISRVPLLLTDEYGRFLRGPNGFPQLVLPNNTVVEGNPAQPVAASTAASSGHAFLDDIAHTAVPGTKTPDPDTVVGGTPPAGTYDNELLDAHFITGDGRGNENIGLTSIHTIFHAEHNRLWADMQRLIGTSTDAAFVAQWKVAGGAWNGERLFQAARFVNEMEYQHLVFGEFVRKFQPAIRPFVAYDPTLRPDITAEFAHAVYRFGHSQLNAVVQRTNDNGANTDIKLLDAFLNPPAFNAGTASAAEASGSIARGMSNQIGNEIDEFVTNTLRNTLLGLPLDLATLNIVRGRDTGMGSLNGVRRTFYAATGDASLAPYANWMDFSLSMRHPESIVNFIAAYGTHPTITAATTLPGKRTAAEALLNDADFMFGQNAWADVNGLPATGVEDIDLWIGGLAEVRTPFGGMLGTTFDFVFKTQMENLQEGDRFYYLGRTAGTNLGVQLETNLFSEIIARNSTADTLPADAFLFPARTFNLATSTAGLTEYPPGSKTWRYVGSQHIVMNGTTGNDRMWAGYGNDTVRGNQGNDWAQGDQGDDQLIGGSGDDLLLDSSGVDIFTGGDGNDFMNGGGPGADAFNGGAGSDVVIGGGYGTATLAGPGIDFVNGGTAGDTIGGDDGEDWLEGNSGADGLTGDSAAPFSIDVNDAGRDVLIGDSGDDLLLGGGLADISVAGAGVDQFLGDFGFDWQTYATATPANDEVARVDLNILVPAAGDILAGLTDGFQDVEAISGGSKNDVIRGDARTTLLSLTPGLDDILTAGDISALGGLTPLMPTGATSWSTGNVLIGGSGADLLEGRAGDDIINGDAFLRVWLSVPAASGITGTPDPADATRVLVASILAARQAIIDGKLAISDIRIVRTVDPNIGAPGVDIAVFTGARANYTITANPNGSVTVTDTTLVDGVDTLTGIETLRFFDGDVVVPSAPRNVAATTGISAITVTWSTPSTAGSSAITGYTVNAYTSVAGGTPVGTCSSVVGTNRCTVTGLTNGRTYYVDVIARSGVGSSVAAPSPRLTVALPFVTVPGAPTNVVSAARSGSAVVSWTAPTSNGGVAITSYTARAWSLSSGGSISSSCSTATTSCTINGLVNGNTYHVDVVAVNAVGTSPPSAPRATTALTSPSAPQTVTAVARSAGATVTWTAPAVAGSTVTGYTATAWSALSGGSSVSTCTTTGALTCTLSGLVNGNTYYVEVTGTNLFGTGPASSPRSPAALVVPGAPTGVTATAANAAASVSWDAVTAAPGGAPVTGYTARAYSALTGGTLVQSCTTTSALTCIIPSLSNGTTYYVDVVATNVFGSGLPSTTRVAVTPAPGVPTAPTAVQARTGNGIATVSWSAPGNNGGSTITGYTARAWSAAASGSIVASCQTATLTCVISGLANGTTYYVDVVATNAIGTGAASSPRASVTPAPTVSGAPTGVVVTVPALNTTLAVTWVAPANNGGSAVTSYTARAFTGSTGGSPVRSCTSSTTSCTITGLTSRTTYYIDVVAVNGVGTSAPSSPRVRAQTAR